MNTIQISGFKAAPAQQSKNITFEAIPKKKPIIVKQHHKSSLEKIPERDFMALLDAMATRLKAMGGHEVSTTASLN